MNEKEQTPQQALQLLDRILQTVQGTRADHVLIQQAIETLARAIRNDEPESK